jgi:hypothetical protein
LSTYRFLTGLGAAVLLSGALLAPASAASADPQIWQRYATFDSFNQCLDRGLDLRWAGVIRSQWKCVGPELWHR